MTAAAWGLDQIVSSLREARCGSDSRAWSECSRQGLPSRQAVIEVIDGLRAAFFPLHFGSPDLDEKSVDYFVGTALDGALRALLEQVRRVLRLEAEAAGPAGVGRSAEELMQEFAARLPSVRKLLGGDLEVAFAGDPAARSLDEILLCYPGFSAITHHRIAHELYRLGVPLLARVIAEISHSATGIDIHPGARIGAGFFIDHGTGVVIGETAVIGARVRVYQGVTLGSKSFPVAEDGSLVKGLPRHPIIEDDVVIYSGATILGRVTIGRGSSIGGNVWLTRSVPPRSHITQAHARSEVFDEGAGI